MTLPGPPAPIRVLVVDDQELVRSGFCVILDAADGITVVGEAADGAAAVASAAAHHPDVVLMDIRMPGMDGLEATRLLTSGSLGPQTPKVVMLTTFDLDEYVYEALRAGASGFLLKDSPRADLIAAVRAAAAGNAMLAPTVTRRLIEAFAHRPPQTMPAPSRLASLTVREREVLVLLARGGSNTEIAGTLFVSEATVKTHVGNLLAKLGLRDRVQAVILAYETGTIIPGQPLDPPDHLFRPNEPLWLAPGGGHVLAVPARVFDVRRLCFRGGLAVLAEDHVHAALLGAAQDGQLDGAAGCRRPQRGEEVVGGAGGLARDRHDQVAPGQAGPRGRAVILNLADEQAVGLGEADRAAQPPGHVAGGDRHAQARRPDRFPAAERVDLAPQRLVGRDGQVEALAEAVGVDP
jgi:DNA-binding NarL/FixJ family response regulator